MLSARAAATQQAQLPHRSHPSILQPYPALPRLLQREGSATTGAAPPGTVKHTQGLGQHTSSLNQQCVRDGEHYRSYEDAYEVECDQTTHHTPKTSSRARSAPFLIRMGREKLSMPPTPRVQMRRNVPRPMLSLHYSEATAGPSTTGHRLRQKEL